MQTERPTMTSLITICSRDPDYYLLLSHILQEKGYRTSITASAAEVMDEIAVRGVGAVLVDCQPGSQLIPELAAALKSEERAAATPVVALVAPGAGNLYLDVLKAGFSESFIRPLAPDHLLSYLRRALPSQDDPGSRRAATGFVHGTITIDIDARRATANGQLLALSPTEFRLLQELLSVPGRVFSRKELIAAAWPEARFVDPRTVDVHIGRLRRELRNAMRRDVIRTLRSEGYAIEVSSS
jgi:two-component system phosphate regulon response regulator PhoB